MPPRSWWRFTKTFNYVVVARRASSRTTHACSTNAGHQQECLRHGGHCHRCGHHGRPLERRWCHRSCRHSAARRPCPPLADPGLTGGARRAPGRTASVPRPCSASLGARAKQRGTRPSGGRRRRVPRSFRDRGSSRRGLQCTPGAAQSRCAWSCGCGAVIKALHYRSASWQVPLAQQCVLDDRSTTGCTSE